MSAQPIRVTVWGEFRHEKRNEVVRKLYPEGMHNTIAAGIRENLGGAVQVRTAVLDDPEHGLTEQVLAETDVLSWWGHGAHKEVKDEVVERVYNRVLKGMGLIVLHSGHYSKIFKKLMGTECGLRWREAAEREILWVVKPSHPIADGLGPYFELPRTEMYGEQFKVPEPDEIIFISWFEGGDVFRSGCTWTRGKGRIFYFRPGHETFPIYHDKNVRRAIANAAKWAAPASSCPYLMGCPNAKEPLAPIAAKHAVDPSIHKAQ